MAIGGRIESKGKLSEILRFASECEEKVDLNRFEIEKRFSKCNEKSETKIVFILFLY